MRPKRIWEKDLRLKLKERQRMKFEKMALEEREQETLTRNMRIRIFTSWHGTQTSITMSTRSSAQFAGISGRLMTW